MPHRIAAMLQLPSLSAIFGLLAAAGVIIDEKTLVPVGTIGAVATIIWWVGRKLQHIDDRLDDLKNQVNEMKQADLEHRKQFRPLKLM